MPILSLAFKSILNRKVTFFLTFLCLAISIMLLLGVQMIKKESKSSFMQSVSGTDLIIGPRSSQIELLLYSVFHIGTPKALMDYHSFKELSQQNNVKWAIPISLGDSHKGFRVVASNDDFFKYITYANSKKLEFEHGSANKEMFDIVLGSEVAKKLDYHIGESIVLSHGNSKVSFIEHEELLFKVKGILKPTHTPLDNNLIISLYAMEALHTEHHDDFLSSGHFHEAKKVHDEDDHHGHKEQKEHESHHHETSTHDHSELTTAQKLAKEIPLLPEKISAIYVGVESKMGILKLQRDINNYKEEPLSAILPFVAIQELWEFFKIAQTALDMMTVLVIVIGLLGMLSVIMMGLKERRREMAILRSVGARPLDIAKLIVGESALVCAISIGVAVLFLYMALFLLSSPLYEMYGFYLEIKPLGVEEIALLLLVEVCAIVISFIPAYLTYKHSLNDGMSVKV